MEERSLEGADVPGLGRSGDDGFKNLNREAMFFGEMS
jgi:hypothetical protein